MGYAMIGINIRASVKMTVGEQAIIHLFAAWHNYAIIIRGIYSSGLPDIKIYEENLYEKTICRHYT